MNFTTSGNGWYQSPTIPPLTEQIVGPGNENGKNFSFRLITHARHVSMRQAIFVIAWVFFLLDYPWAERLLCLYYFFLFIICGKEIKAIYFITGIFPGKRIKNLQIPFQSQLFVKLILNTKQLLFSAHYTCASRFHAAGNFRDHSCDFPSLSLSGKRDCFWSKLTIRAEEIKAIYFITGIFPGKRNKTFTASFSVAVFYQINTKLESF